MQPLPNIEVLSFLNWMDINGYARDRIGVPLDELFLNDEYREQVCDLEQEYMRIRRMDTYSERATYERYVDCVLSEIKHHLMMEFDRNPPRNHYSSHNYLYGNAASLRYFRSLEQAFHRINLNDFKYLEKQLDATQMKHFQSGLLLASVREYLGNYKNSAVIKYFLRNPNSTAASTLHFLEWVQQRNILKNTNMRNVPAQVMAGYIREHIWSEYQRKGFSEREKTRKEELLCRILIQHKYDTYLGNILEEVDSVDYSLENVVRRSLNREAHYKCTLLAQDNTFQLLVRDYWEEMNDCSGNHLDIYYSESELEQRGRSTADKLLIRGRVTQYPAIYIWEYSMDQGFSIPVARLNNHELMDLFRGITDNIAKGCDLKQVVDSANQDVERIIKSKNASIEQEQIFTHKLLDACAKLQSNENYVRNTDENGRNTYIKHLLNTAGYMVDDQTLGGLSPTAKSAGEIDLKVYSSDGMPFTILEALNISTAHPCAWDRRNFRNHVNKLYAYDANGLERNYVIVYATTPDFGRFTQEVQKLIGSPGKCPYGEADQIGVAPIHTGFADISMVCSKYLRNDRETRLYILCVRMAEKKVTIPASK